MIPNRAGLMPDLDEANAALQQPAGHHNLAGLDSVAIHSANRFWFLADIESVARFHLHPER
jgi:hypothetical protein